MELTNKKTLDLLIKYLENGKITVQDTFTAEIHLTDEEIDEMLTPTYGTVNIEDYNEKLEDLISGYLNDMLEERN